MVVRTGVNERQNKETASRWTKPGSRTAAGPGVPPGEPAQQASQEARLASRGLLDCVCSNTAYCNLQVPQVHREKTAASQQTLREQTFAFFTSGLKRMNSLKTSSAWLSKETLKAEPGGTESAVFIRLRKEECVGPAPRVSSLKTHN